MLIALIDIILYLLNILSIIVIVQVILSWLVAFNVVNLQQSFVRGLYVALEKITAPLYRPIHKILPDFGGIDFSPLVLLIAINVLSMLVVGVGNSLLTGSL